MKISKNMTTFLIVVLLISVIQITRFINKRPVPNWVKGPHPRAQGNPAAPLHIVEYTDFQCPACSAGAKILEDYLEKYPNKIFVEYKYFPITRIHPYALKSAVYAECSGRQGKFWPFHNMLYENRKRFHGKVFARRELLKIAEALDLDFKDLKACVDDVSVEKMVLSERDEGRSLGVSATPTYFVNGKIVVGIKSIRKELEKFFGEVRSKNANKKDK